LLKAAQTSRYWRQLSEDNLLWREKCRKMGIDDPSEILAELSPPPPPPAQPPVLPTRSVRSCASSWTPPPADDGMDYVLSPLPLLPAVLQQQTRRVSPLENMAQLCPWKAAFLRQSRVENNWRTRPLQTAKVLRGHDDHVITCLQFCDNRIISGSDDSTLKVWSVATGRVSVSSSSFAFSFESLMGLLFVP
jgi:WD40 repeat protein